MTHSLTDELVTLLGRSDSPGPAFEQWRERCEEVLSRLPEIERRALQEELQRVLAENRSLFERESQVILDELVDGRRNLAGAAKAGRYKSVKDLKS